MGMRLMRWGGSYAAAPRHQLNKTDFGAGTVHTPSTTSENQESVWI
jgi:hypothetical protein